MADNLTGEVLFLHGWGGSHERTWVRLGWAERMRAAGFAVEGLNLLGHGVPAASHDPQAYADIVGPVRAALAGRRGLVGIGYSLGAKILLQLSAETPGLFARLVLIGLGNNAFRPLGASQALSSALLEGVPATAAPAFVRMIEEVKATGNDIRAMAACITRPQETPLRPEDLASVRHPVCIVNGALDNFVLPQDELARALPSAQQRLFEGYDHLDIVEKGDVIDFVVDLLAAEGPHAAGIDESAR